MKTRNRNKSILTLAAVAVAALAFTVSSANAAVFSFNLDSGTVTGDVPGADNLNGLQITGQVGDWAIIGTGLTGGKSSATDDGVTLEFDLNAAGANWGSTVGTRGAVGARATRVGTAIGSSADISWTLTGLTPNASYDMIWYNKNLSQTRAPNTGVDGFDAGNGVGLSGIHDADDDQNFLGVVADGSGTISGTWFHTGGLENLSAVAGVQITAAEVAANGTPEPSALILAALAFVGLVGTRRRRKR